MKFIIVAALIAFVAIASAQAYDLTLTNKLSEEQRTLARGFAMECIQKEGVSLEAVVELNEGNFANADDKLKAFANCFLEKAGFLVDGVPQIDVINTNFLPLVGEAELKAIGEKCNGLKGSSNAETAYKLYECYFTTHYSF